MADLDPNRAAISPEAEIVRDNIIHDGRVLSVLDEQVARAESVAHAVRQRMLAEQRAFASAQAQVDHLRTEKTSVADRMNASRGLLHPVRRLPDEMLREIFLDWLHTVFHSADLVPYVYAKDNRRISPVRAAGVPFCAAAVCKRWRRIALESSELWAHPIIFTDDLVQSRYITWHGFVVTHLQRSHERPLALRLISDHGHTSSFAVKLVARLTPRLGELHIDRGHDQDIICLPDTLPLRETTPAHVLFDRVFRLLMPKLHLLRVHQVLEPKVRAGPEFAPEPVRLITAMVPNLEKIEAVNWQVTFSARHPLINVCSLLVQPDTHTGVQIGRDDLACWAWSLPNLNSLVLPTIHFVDEDEDEDEDETQPVVFPNLLKLGLCGRVSGRVLDKVRFPALKTARVALFGRREGGAAVHDSISFLENALVIDDNDACHPLADLTLQYVDADKRLAEALWEFPDLEELCLHDFKYSKAFGDALSTSEWEDGTNEWLTPKLHSLEMIGMWVKEMKLLKSAHKAVQKRCDAAQRTGGPAHLLHCVEWTQNLEDIAPPWSHLT